MLLAFSGYSQVKNPKTVAQMSGEVIDQDCYGEFNDGFTHMDGFTVCNYRVLGLAQGNPATDKVMVINAGNKYVRETPPVPTQIATYTATRYTFNATTVALTTASLNISHSSEAVGHIVTCPYITAGGEMYIKTLENGSTDVWQTIVAPVTP